MGKILAAIKPEATYFTEIEGQRTALLIVNLETASQIPSIAEPFFLNFNGRVPHSSGDVAGRFAEGRSC